MKRLINYLFGLQDEAYDDGWQDGVVAGYKAARHLLYEDLKRIGSTGDNLEVPWSMVDSLLNPKEN